MAQQSLNMASGVPKTLGPGILAASSPNINLSTNMASEAISEDLISKNFYEGAYPQTPLCVHQCPYNRKYMYDAFHTGL